MKTTVEIQKPFGPSIARIKMSEDLIKKLNDYTDEVIKDEIKSKKLDHGHTLAGNVNQEIVLESNFASQSGLLKFLANGVSTWIKTIDKKQIKNFKITSSWIVRQFQYEYNPIHGHSGHISGVGYLKVPKDFGETFQNNKINLNGKISFVHGSRQFLSNNVLTISPAVGDFYLFPHYLSHMVYPFFNKNNDERRSISFNAKIDENNYDVYGGKADGGKEN